MQSDDIFEEPISVLTVSRRTDTIERCISSIESQDYQGFINHIVVVDGCQETLEDWKHLTQKSQITIHFEKRSSKDRNGPARLAYLRNIAIQLSSDNYVVFLDDDNSWSINHLSSLWKTLASSEFFLAHSHRFIYHQDGQPYLLEEFPWKRNKDERIKIYNSLSDLEVFTRGSNIVKDFLGMPHSCVDLGEWLFTREFLLTNQFSCTYSDEDWFRIVVEDAKLQQAIIDSKIPVICTNLPTLHYFLGGYSNNFSDSASIFWEEP